MVLFGHTIRPFRGMTREVFCRLMHEGLYRELRLILNDFTNVGNVHLSCVFALDEHDVVEISRVRAGGAYVVPRKGADFLAFYHLPANATISDAFDVLEGQLESIDGYYLRLMATVTIE